MMNQRMALIIALGLTVFVLVLVGGVAMNLTGRSSTTAAPAPVVQSPNTVALPAPKTTALSPELAANIARNVAPGAVLQRQPELVVFQGKLAFEVMLDRGVLYVDANSGEILYNGITSPVAAPAPGGGGAYAHQDDEHEEHEGAEEHGNRPSVSRSQNALPNSVNIFGASSRENHDNHESHAEGDD